MATSFGILKSNPHGQSYSTENVVVGVFAAPMSVRSNQPVFVGESMTLKRVVQTRGVQRWEIDTRLNPESSNSNLLIAEMLRASYNKALKVRFPQSIGSIDRRIFGGPVSPLGTAGSTTVNLSTSSTIPAGTFIKFSNHDKVYITLSERDSGSPVVDIFPALRKNVNTTDTVFWQDDIVIDMLLDTENILGMSFIDGILMDLGSIKLLEIV